MHLASNEKPLTSPSNRISPTCVAMSEARLPRILILLAIYDELSGFQLLPFHFLLFDSGGIMATLMTTNKYFLPLLVIFVIRLLKIFGFIIIIIAKIRFEYEVFF